MTTISSARYQYRTFEHVYLFKVKSDQSVTLKIFNLARKCLWKKAFSAKDLELSNIKTAFAGRNFIKVINELTTKEPLPKEYSFLPAVKVLKSGPEKALADAINNFKPNVVADEEQIKDYICPITCEVFKDPVMDDHGHTFEKSAIDKHMKVNNKKCPLDRRIIKTLIPNRVAKETVDKWHSQDPIPSFSSFKKENEKLASTNLSLARTYAEEKEYTEAIECYSKAFQYTNNWSDYTDLPALFEAMGEKEKATLAYLYLARYQLTAGESALAIATLERCQEGKTSYFRCNLVLSQLYEVLHNSEKALELSILFAEGLSKQNPDEAIKIYKQILIQHPEQLSLYLPLSELLKDQKEKIQLLLKGALQAMYLKDYKLAKDLFEKTKPSTNTCFIDQLVYIETLKKQGDLLALKKQLHALAKVFEDNFQTRDMLRTYKMLYAIEKQPEYAEKIYIAYGKVRKPKKEIDWSLTYLNHLISNKNWEEAEEIAQQTLKKTDQLEQKIFLYEQLEVVYTNWQGRKLENLWDKLGKAYGENKQLELAEKTYQKAFERFHGFEQCMAYANALAEKGEIQKSVGIYYDASVQALVEEDTKKLSFCVQEMKKVDPAMNHLDPRQKMDLLIQSQILKLSNQLEKSEQRLCEFERKTARLFPIFLERISESPRVTDIEQLVLNFPFVEELEFEDWSWITPLGFSYLRTLKNLKVLKLNNWSTYYSTYCSITDLASLKGLPVALDTLDYTGCSSVIDKGLETLAQAPLKRLILGRAETKSSSRHSSNSKDEGLKELTEESLKYLQKTDSLEYLDITGLDLVSGSGLKFLYDLPLKHIKLNFPIMNDKNIQQWAEFIRKCHSKIDSDLTINVEDNTSSIMALASLKGLPVVLNTLDFTGFSNVSNVGLRVIAQVPLKRLILGRSKNKYSSFKGLTDLSLKYLQEMDSLEYLDITGLHLVSGTRLKFLYDLPLKHIKVDFPKMNGKNIQQWTEFIRKYHSIIDSDLIISFEDGYKSKYTPTLKDFQYLQGLPLVELNCGSNKLFTNKKVACLAGMPLKKLNLSHSKITDEGVSSLDGMPLEELNLQETKITDKAISYLVGMPLKSLNLNGTEITDGAIQYIKQLPLEQLDIRNYRNISEEGEKELRALKIKKIYIFKDRELQRDRRISPYGNIDWWKKPLQ